MLLSWPLLYPSGEAVHYELSGFRGNDECCHHHEGLAAEGTGYPVGALSIIRRAFVLAALAKFSYFFHIVPCTHSAGAASAASGTAGSTSPRIWEQAWCLLQVWQRWPLCPSLSPEPASSVRSTISELQVGQMDHDQEEGA